MYFYSTNKTSKKVNLKEAIMRGQADDHGLYMPESIPALGPNIIKEFSQMEYWEIATEVLHSFSKEEIDKETLAKLCKEAYDFDLPIEEITQNISVARLDKGPTAAFKDYAARIMARLVNYFLQQTKEKINILVATSGDTGSAIASAFYNLSGIQVWVLFPPKEVSQVQRKLMTTLGGNITCLAVDGKFDDCQRLVKTAFADADNQNLKITSANSINIGRLLPQSVYYFYIASRLQVNPKDLVISVPSGNFGNLMGGLIADRMGLDFKKIIAATNSNDAFTTFYNTQKYQPIKPSKYCISNAMNVGAPNNITRIIDLFEGSMNEKNEILTQPDFVHLKNKIYATSFDDDATKLAIQRVWKETEILLEPHGAIGYLGLQEYLQKFGQDSDQGIVLETAHPSKFPAEMESILGFSSKPTKSIQKAQEMSEKYETISSDYEDFKKLLKDRL